MKRVLKEILSTSLYLLVVLVITYLVIHFVGQRTQVQGESMEPMLQDGDNLIVDKITYHFKAPQRFDIIVFPFQYKEDTYYIKRIIGLPGETVQIREGNVYIDGVLLAENELFDKIADPGIAQSELLLGSDEFFVLGDNRNASSDSRDPSVGMIQREDIVGRAWLRIYPFDKVGFIRHQ